MPKILRCLLLVAAATLAHSNCRAAPLFKHVIIVIQENRTPDNLFGSNPNFEPGVDLATSGTTSTGATVPLTAVPLANCYDLSHTHAGFEVSLNKGADRNGAKGSTGCTLPANPQYKFVDNSAGAVAPYFAIAQNYGFANRMFQTNQGPSFPAHQFLFGGTSSPNTESPIFAAENQLYGKQAVGCAAPSTQRVATINAAGVESNPGIYPCFTRPTMGDLLNKAKLSWRYYGPSAGSIWLAPAALSQICGATTVNGVTSCAGSVWNSHVVADNPARILTDISGCNLSAVSWVTPTGPESDHAAITDGTGPAWVASIVNTLGTQAPCGAGQENYWQDTAILVLWDDWGGWFDHVKPFNVVSAPSWGAGYTYGFRVPLLVVSAYTQAGTVSNTPYDFGSLLYFIEQNFGLGFIGPGSTAYSNFADYHAASRGPLSDFFTLQTPKSFMPIPSPQGAAFFLARPVSPIPPDDD